MNRKASWIASRCDRPETYMVIWKCESVKKWHWSVLKLEVYVATKNYLRCFICVTFQFLYFIILLTLTKLLQSDRQSANTDKVIPWLITDHWLSLNCRRDDDLLTTMAPSNWAFWSIVLNKNNDYFFIHTKSIDFLTFDGWLKPDWLQVVVSEMVVHFSCSPAYSADFGEE